jgi:hypothetical protein
LHRKAGSARPSNELDVFFLTNDGIALTTINGSPGFRSNANLTIVNASRPGNLLDCTDLRIRVLARDGGWHGFSVLVTDSRGQEVTGVSIGSSPYAEQPVSITSRS